LTRISQLARIRLARLRRHGHHLRARLAQPVQRIPDFHLLIHLVHQDRYLLTFEVHTQILPFLRFCPVLFWPSWRPLQLNSCSTSSVVSPSTSNSTSPPSKSPESSIPTSTPRTTSAFSIT